MSKRLNFTDIESLYGPAKNSWSNKNQYPSAAEISAAWGTAIKIAGATNNNSLVGAENLSPGIVYTTVQKVQIDMALTNKMDIAYWTTTELNEIKNKKYIFEGDIDLVISVMGVKGSLPVTSEFELYLTPDNKQLRVKITTTEDIGTEGLTITPFPSSGGNYILEMIVNLHKTIYGGYLKINGNASSKYSLQYPGFGVNSEKIYNSQVSAEFNAASFDTSTGLFSYKPANTKPFGQIYLGHQMQNTNQHQISIRLNNKYSDISSAQMLCNSASPGNFMGLSKGSPMYMIYYNLTTYPRFLKLFTAIPNDVNNQDSGVLIFLNFKETTNTWGIKMTHNYPGTIDFQGGGDDLGILMFDSAKSFVSWYNAYCNNPNYYINLN